MFPQDVESAIAAASGTSLAVTVREGAPNGALASELNAAKAAWNATIRPVRCRIEKVFGTAKRSYGLRGARPASSNLST